MTGVVLGWSGNVEAWQIPWSSFLGLFHLCVDGELDFFQAIVRGPIGSLPLVRNVFCFVPLLE